MNLIKNSAKFNSLVKELTSSLFKKKLNEMKVYLNLEFLSMGMTEDYVEAVKLGSTHLRIGSKIFGARD